MKIKKFIKINNILIILYVMKTSLINTIPVFAISKAVPVISKANLELLLIRKVLMIIIVVVGVIWVLKVIISKLPSLDDQHIRSELWKNIVTIVILVAVGSLLIWLIFYTIIGTSYAAP